MNGHSRNIWRFAWWKSALLGVSMAVSAVAHADTMLISKNVMVTSPSVPNIETLNMTAAGSLTVSVSDLNWPQALQSLSFAITDGKGVLASLSSAGSLIYRVTGPMALFADIYAVPDSAVATGAYHLNVLFTPAVPAVPLPAAGWLFFSGLASLWAARKKTSFVQKTVIQAV